jgi:hypothetical protein
LRNTCDEIRFLRPHILELVDEEVELGEGLQLRKELHSLQ